MLVKKTNQIDPRLTNPSLNGNYFVFFSFFFSSFPLISHRPIHIPVVIVSVLDFLSFGVINSFFFSQPNHSNFFEINEIS